MENVVLANTAFFYQLIGIKQFSIANAYAAAVAEATIKAQAINVRERRPMENGKMSC